jgi:hypothetical protein
VLLRWAIEVRFWVSEDGVVFRFEAVLSGLSRCTVLLLPLYPV